jgi:dienelactone hydrolase
MKLSFKSSVLIILATFMLTFSIYGNCKNNEIIGAWEGILDVSGTKLRLVFNIHEDSSGNFISTMDSPDQGAIGINVDNITLKNDKIILRIISINGTYEGNICKERKSIEGMWKQGNHSFPLNLKKTEKKITFKRPQEPKKPYPYIVKDISFKNKSAGITLAGTLTLPTAGKPFPAVILITGSGRPFLILADYLSRKGIAVLRFDDRGVGKSTGDFSKATSAEFATDVVSGMEYLRKRKDIDPNKIGLLGHSEGGLIAPMIAAKNRDVAFIVLMAGSGLPGNEILNLQSRLIAKASGVSEKDIEESMTINNKIYTVIKTENDSVKT